MRYQQKRKNERKNPRQNPPSTLLTPPHQSGAASWVKNAIAVA